MSSQTLYQQVINTPPLNNKVTGAPQDPVTCGSDCQNSSSSGFCESQCEKKYPCSPKMQYVPGAQFTYAPGGKTTVDWGTSQPIKWKHTYMTGSPTSGYCGNTKQPSMSDSSNIDRKHQPDKYPTCKGDSDCTGTDETCVFNTSGKEPNITRIPIDQCASTPDCLAQNPNLGTATEAAAKAKSMIASCQAKVDDCKSHCNLGPTNSTCQSHCTNVKGAQWVDNLQSKYFNTEEFGCVNFPISESQKDSRFNTYCSDALPKDFTLQQCSDGFCAYKKKNLAKSESK